jgi:aspartyl-tRNA(Asn)/glutamyl-tRNA(Gln) amidotransferase subunit B
VAKARDAKLAANWVITNLFGALNKRGLGMSESPVSAANLGALLDLMGDGTISGRIAKDVFEDMMETGRDAGSIVEKEGLRQITDEGEIEAAVDAQIAANPEQAQEVRDGKEKTIGWFMGQVMKATGGKANPKLVNEMLKRKLSG